MDEFLRYVVGKLVEFPDEVIISHREEGDTTVFLLALRKSDRPKIIGKGGHTIQALRTLLQASAQKKGIRAGLELLE